MTWVPDGESYNFALYSKHAEEVTLLLFTTDNLLEAAVERRLDFRTNKSGPVWHCRVRRDEARGARYYGYRVSGPPPGDGLAHHDFDPEKVLLDPYATSVHFPPGFSRSAASEPGSNAGRAPLGVLDDARGRADFPWRGDIPPCHDSDLVIYEMHVRGFTRHPSSGVPAPEAGTFAGVIEKIPYLLDLGITAVELMPVYQFDPDEGNYWGYMPLNFFSPHHGYAVDGGDPRPHDEFREMVCALHRAGIEVILDVVYNHTTESDRDGPTYSFRGIDSTTYYVMSGDPAVPYADFTGCGNTLHTRNRAVRELIIESLRHWVADCRVNGFRFDLASIFTRGADGAVGPEDPPIFGEISSHPEFDGVHLIAEPWDAHGLFDLGHRFPGTMWMQWNARYRDTLQKFVRGDGGMVADLMTRIYGSADIFPDTREEACRPFQSVNYITSHDGFTLYDLVSYDEKRNWANGHENADGATQFSWNCGWEGDDGAPEAVLALRKRQVKNFFALLMLSNGTPMFHMGDEFLQTQGGNSNPYNQDNETSWLDWSRLDEHRDMFRFVKGLIAFRKAHPSISRSRFWRDDVRWFGTGPEADLAPESRQLAFRLRGTSQDDDDLYVMINAADGECAFGIHDGPADGWRRAVDTARPAPHDLAEPGAEEPLGGDPCVVAGRSVVVLVRKREPGDGPAAGA